MRIHLSSVFVDDQDKALHFYTEVLGFVKKHEVPVGEADVSHCPPIPECTDILECFDDPPSPGALCQAAAYQAAQQESDREQHRYLVGGIAVGAVGLTIFGVGLYYAYHPHPVSGAEAPGTT